MSENRPDPATAAGKQAADDPTRQRPTDSGGAEAPTNEWAAPEAEQAHGEAIAAAAADRVHDREATQAAEEAEQARDEAEKLSRKERKAREKAEAERAKAEAEREKADEAARREQGEAMAAAAEADVKAADPVAAAGVHIDSSATVSGDTLASPTGEQPPSFATPGPAPAASSGSDRPEVLVGAAFAGAFLFAQLLKRVTNR